MHSGKSERWLRLRGIIGLPDEWLPPMAHDMTQDIPANLLTEETTRLVNAYHAIGYENYVSFYNVFKRLEGMTPSEYRFRNRGAATGEEK